MIDEKTRSFLDRLSKLGLLEIRHPVVRQVRWYQLTHSSTLWKQIDKQLGILEAQQLENPFLEPRDNCGLEEGDARCLSTSPSGHPVGFNFQPGNSNHIVIGGKAGTGKSFAQAAIASAAAEAGCYTVVISTTDSLRQISCLNRRHTFVRLQDLVWNLWDFAPGVPYTLADQWVVADIARSYSLYYSAYEIMLAIGDIRGRGETPNLISLIRELIKKRATLRGYTKRPQYIDSAVLVLKNLLSATGTLFRCAHGQDISKQLRNNIVIEIQTLPEHAAFLCRSLLTYLLLMATIGQKLDKQLLLVIDEGQILASMEQLNEKMLTLRHLGVILSINFQNFSQAPIEMVGNCDVLMSFQSTDRRDREAFAKSANLTKQQSERLAVLEHECVCFMPRSSWRKPFLARVDRLDSATLTSDQVARQSREFTSRFKWLPVQTTGEAVRQPESGERSALDANAELFMRDVLNQAHEFSPVTQRWERSGIRSADMQQRVLKRLRGDGLMREESLAIGRGRPIKLIEPTKRGLEEFGVQWKPRGRGTLRTRAATQYLYQKLRKLDGWQCVREAELGGHQIDLLCRTREGEAVSVEIAGNPTHEAFNVLAVSGQVLRHYVVCVDGKVMEGVKRRVAQHGELKENERINVLTVAQALSDKWTP